MLVILASSSSLLACNAVFGVDDLVFESASDGGGGTGPSSVCGDGVLQQPPEQCDDQNQATGDGCAQCMIQPGYVCSGAPSQCTAIEPQVITQGPGLQHTIWDDGYDGSIGNMTCADLLVPDNGYDEIQRVEVNVGLEQDYAGHLTIKLKSPSGTVTTLMSRPGFNETADDGQQSGGGCQAALEPDGVIFFRDSSTNDAENMGDTCGTNAVICKDDGPCDYHPNPGAGPGSSLADFNGEDPVGTWRLCVGDYQPLDGNGRLDFVQLTVLSW